MPLGEQSCIQPLDFKFLIAQKAKLSTVWKGRLCERMCRKPVQCVVFLPVPVEPHLHKHFDKFRFLLDPREKLILVF